MPRPTSAADPGLPMRVVLVTMDAHLSSAAARAQHELGRLLPGVRLVVHAAAEWDSQPESLARCRADIASADLVIATMLFMEEHFLPILEDLRARRDACDAMVCAMSAPPVMKLTRMGRFTMDGKTGGPMAMLRRLRGKDSSGQDGADKARSGASAGAQQMKMLRRLPKILRFIPGTAQDVRIYLLVLQYWLAGSQENLAGMVHLLVDRYAAGPRAGLRGRSTPAAPVDYPELGLYHPQLPGRIATEVADLPARGGPATVGLLLMRSYLLAGNTAHYDGVIAALEARGLRVLPAFATGLDARPAVERFFFRNGRPVVDSVISLTGFSLVGGPAYNDAQAAETLLARLDVPYLSVLPVEFQTLEQWGASERGLLPLEATMMVALPELDGATSPMVYGGRSDGAGKACTGCARGCTFAAGASRHDMHGCPDRAERLAGRIDRLVRLRRSQRAERRVGLVLFNFPPNAGNTGTAAHLSVFESLYQTLATLQREGYQVELPASVDALRDRLLVGNSARLGACANVHVRIPVGDHVRREPWLREIEAHWGPAPGRQLSDGQTLHVLGERFGNVFVGIQPAFGHEGDPMKLLFERGFAPTHAFSAFYRWLREDFGAHAVLHFGTHGALEFMPGKQAGLSGDCWPDRLMGDLPNLYLYAANNPSEGLLAKRRSAATLISHMTPPLSQAGLYKGLIELQDGLARWRRLPPGQSLERAALAPLIQAQAQVLALVPEDAEPWGADALPAIERLQGELLELEQTLIPNGLHVLGRIHTQAQRLSLLEASATAHFAAGQGPSPAALEALAAGRSAAEALLAEGRSAERERLEPYERLALTSRLLSRNPELEAIVHALDGGYLAPAPGGDLLRNPDVLPTGRNLHGFDPSRLPSAYAVQDGAQQAERLLARHQAEGYRLPESIALVLWGTDNLKSEGAPIAQALALMGARPRFDDYGRLAGAQLVTLAELGRPRIDVMVTLSGIFRDLLPMQIRLLAEAAFLAASADEPEHLNFVRKHALAHQREHGGDLETAALRVFGNAESAYGANLGSLIDNGAWAETDELAETFVRRKGFAYGRSGRPVQKAALLASVLQQVELAYQNLDSVELGVTTVDTYFDTLGGVSRAVQRAKGPRSVVAPVYIGDQTDGQHAVVRTLGEQVALETRTRMLNPTWYEGMLEHGYEGVRQIEAHLTHTLGWSATTGQVAPWVYRQLSETFVLDPAMRERLARLNPTASARMAQRLLEASERDYWQPDEATLAALQHASDELEDRLEGVPTEKAAA